MKTVQEIAKNIQTAGLKVTPQRVAVVQALDKLNHPGAEDIYKEVSHQIPGLSPATVYNILEALVSKELIKKVPTETGIMKYDAVSEHHHHIYCKQSNRMDDYFDPELDNLLQDYFQRKKIKGFEIREMKLHLLGAYRNKKKE